MTPIRVAVADDHALVRAGLQALLVSIPGVVVVGEASHSQGLLDLLATHAVDVVLCDIQMPGPDGIDCIERIGREHPGVRAIVVSMDDRPATVRLACSRGASGYLSKMADAGTLETALRIVAGGGTYLSPRIARSLLEHDADAPESLLTQRQVQIVTQVALGRTSREIGGLLGISARTIEMHRARIMERLALTDVAALTRYAIRHRLVR